MSDSISYLFDEEAGDVVGLDDVKRTEFLNSIETLGSIKASAARVGLTTSMVADALAADARLESDVQVAQGRYEANLLERMAHLAFQGSEKAIIGGKNKNEVLGVDNIPNDKALELLARMRFADDLAIVTRQRLTAEIKPTGKGEVPADFSSLSREDRKAMTEILKKAQVAAIPEDK